MQRTISALATAIATGTEVIASDGNSCPVPLKVTANPIAACWTEDRVRADGRTILPLPYPFMTPTGPDSPFEWMFAWNTDFVSRALIAHERLELIRGHIENHLFVIDRLGSCRTPTSRSPRTGRRRR